MRVCECVCIRVKRNRRTCGAGPDREQVARTFVGQRRGHAFAPPSRRNYYYYNDDGRVLKPTELNGIYTRTYNNNSNSNNIIVYNGAAAAAAIAAII